MDFLMGLSKSDSKYGTDQNVGRGHRHSHGGGGDHSACRCE